MPWTQVASNPASEHSRICQRKGSTIQTRLELVQSRANPKLYGFIFQPPSLSFRQPQRKAAWILLEKTKQ